MNNLRFVCPDGSEVTFENWTHESKFGVKWEQNGKTVFIDFGYHIGAQPTPKFDGIVITYPEYEKSPVKFPDNAVIYNSDGSLRFQLKAPKPLSRHLPGYTHTPEEVAKIHPDGFIQTGWRTNDFGEICTWETPYLMWANIGLHCDVYERRYFDPDTGKFDPEHFHTGRY